MKADRTSWLRATARIARHAVAACLAAAPALAAPVPPDSAATLAAVRRATAASYPHAEAVVVYDRQREEYTASGTSILERARLVKVLHQGPAEAWLPKASGMYFH